MIPYALRDASVFRKSRESGLSLRQIAKLNGVSYETVRRRLGYEPYPCRLKYSTIKWQQARWKLAHPDYNRDYCKAWRERKKRQAAAIDGILNAVDRWEYARRCAEVSAEAHGR